MVHKRDAELHNVRKVRLREEQEVWVRFDTYRDDEGYMAIDVVTPPRSDAAILAAIIAYVAEPMEYEQLREARRFVSSADRMALEERIKTLEKKFQEAEALGKAVEFEDLVASLNLGDELISKLKPMRPLGYMLPLLEYYKPEVKEYSGRQVDEVLEKTCYYVNNFLEALRELQAFLEYGAPDRKLTQSVREPNRDVRVAILRDVDGLSYRQIGDKLQIPLPPDFEVKGEHQTVRKMAARGRRILEQAFGEEGWRGRVEAMKAEKAWWQSLSEEEQYREWEVESTALHLDITTEEARQRIERRRL